MAEGRSGPFREAFFPAIFDELGLAHTGSSAGVLSLCLDKALSKRLVEAEGGYVPYGLLVTSERDLADLVSVPVPAIVKPNFEGSSKGITQASIVSDRSELRDVVMRALAKWPNGVLVERYVEGADVSVAFVEGIGLLAPVGYAYEPTGKYRILDLASKQAPERVQLEVPATIGERERAVVVRAAERAFSALGVTGYGRADFRVKDGVAHFLEMNPLPSLANGDDEVWASAAVAGFSRLDVMRAIAASPHSRGPATREARTAR